MVKFVETESRMVVTRDLEGVGNGEFNGYRVSDLQDEKVLEMCFAALNILSTTEMSTYSV